jgi:peroxiredoxin-like protein
MVDLMFESEVCWEGHGRNGVGTVATGGQKIVYSAPASMGGRGMGTSPEELLISAVASCYSGTLFHLLARDGLSGDEVRVRAVGTVSDHPSTAARFSRLVVHPTIVGADSRRQSAYEACARTAREHCFIGRALRETISYEVGDVTLHTSTPAHASVA